jgi:hypothetical protein
MHRPQPALIAALVLAATVAGCTSMRNEQVDTGDFVVVTHVRLVGLEKARLENVKAAGTQCPEGFVTFDEADGQDLTGIYSRLEYGCSVAPP